MGNKVVVLDIGHGGRDSGAIGIKTQEKNNNLTLGLKVGKILQQHGVTVNYTRDTDKDFCPNSYDVNIDLTNRIAIAKQYNPDVYCSLHNNAFNKQAKGIEVHCFKFGGGDQKLAQRVLNQLSNLNFINRGTKASNFYVLRKFDGTNTDACLVEYGFIDSEEDAILANMDNASVAISKGVLEHLGIKYKEPITSTIQSTINDNNQGSEIKMETCVVYFSPADFSSALIISNLNKSCAMFCRNASSSFNSDVLKFSKIITVGGPKLNVNGEIYLSGNGASDTLIAVSKYLQGK